MTEGEIPEDGEGEAAAVGGETDAPAAEPNESEAGSAPDDLSQAVEPEDPKGVAKRIGKLLAEKRELEQRLEAAEAKAKEATGEGARPPVAIPDRLAEVEDPRELHRQEALEARIEGLAERLLDTLEEDVEAVAAELQKLNAKPTNMRGEEDYSQPAMGRYLRNELKAARERKAAVVAAKQSLEAKHARMARELLPYLNEANDERTKAIQRLLAANPEVRALPFADYWAACAERGNREIQAELKGKPRVVPAPAKPAVKPPPRATGGSSQPKPAANLVRAKERLAGERSKEALTEVFEALG